MFHVGVDLYQRCDLIMTDSIRTVVHTHTAVLYTDTYGSEVHVSVTSLRCSYTNIH